MIKLINDELCEKKSQPNILKSESLASPESQSQFQSSIQFQRNKQGQGGVRQRIFSTSLKSKIKNLNKRITLLQQPLIQQDLTGQKVQFEVPSEEENAQKDEQSSSDADIIKQKVSPWIKYEDNCVVLTSPTFGDTIKIRNPKVQFGSSSNALKDLRHIEEQILEMSVLPDFGYERDNYILSHQGNSSNKWRTFTGLLENPKKFAWLLEYSSYLKLEKKIREKEKAKILQKQIQQQASTSAKELKKLKDIEQESQYQKKGFIVKGAQELVQLQKIQEQSRNTLATFKSLADKSVKTESAAPTRRLLTQQRSRALYLKLCQNSSLKTQSTTSEEDLMSATELDASAKVKMRHKLQKQLKVEDQQLQQKITISFKEIKNNQKVELNLSHLPKLLQAKKAVEALIRACEKNNFMLLDTIYPCPEDLTQFVNEVPTLIEQFNDYIMSKRMRHSGLSYLDKMTKSLNQRSVKMLSLRKQSLESQNTKSLIQTSYNKPQSLRTNKDQLSIRHLKANHTQVQENLHQAIKLRDCRSANPTATRKKSINNNTITWVQKQFVRSGSRSGWRSVVKPSQVNERTDNVSESSQRLLEQSCVNLKFLYPQTALNTTLTSPNMNQMSKGNANIAFKSPIRARISQNLIGKKGSYQSSLKPNLNLKITENEFSTNSSLKVCSTQETLKRVRAENFRVLKQAFLT